MNPGSRFVALVVAPALLLATMLAPGGRAHSAEPARLLAGFSRTYAMIETRHACHLLDVFLAITPEQRAQGLMYIRELDEFEGMLFPNSEPAVASMWMKNTYLSLDMLFIGTDGRIDLIAERTTPLSEHTITSEEPVLAVLELAAGFAARHGVAPGDRFLLLP